jgi:hypothetical protein
MKEAWIGLVLAINQSNPIGSVCLVATMHGQHACYYWASHLRRFASLVKEVVSWLAAEFSVCVIGGTSSTLGGGNERYSKSQ